jgi:hypothetical protein
MKITQTGSHLDHMLRQTRMHHVQLSLMADAKANGLMTMSAVMMTLSAPYLGNPQFATGATVLIGFCLLTILLGTYTVVPKLGLFSKQEPRGPESPGYNLLFFADFAHLSLDAFKAEMEEVMNDPSRTYEVQVQEIHALGKYLADRKYRALKMAYVSFVTGLFISMGVFLLEHR